jgi:signal transduction histidine kinase/anti-sigma regulatory factor (Ser/Thr protein kinase)
LQPIDFRGVCMYLLRTEGIRLATLSFTVDAALLRELGERLIGQPHIALAELAKNAYDADAATCRITFGKDEIVISDDGKGMSLPEFRDFWMRIGTTHKVDQRRSARLGRALTGSKGVGRLAVQFLADEMTIETTSEDDESRMLVAVVDWRDAIRGNELASVPVEVDVVPNQPAYPNEHPHGTRIVLTQLKNPWGREELQKLGGEIWTLRSPFRRRTHVPTTRGPEDFDVEIEAPLIEGARESFDDVMQRLFSNWRARIRGTLEQGRLGNEATIALEFAPEADGLEQETFRERISLPIERKPNESDASDTKRISRPLVDRVSFEILIFKIEGRQVGGVHVGDLREYLQEYGNVSIYDSGFRLPYYGTKHDWLDIALDQSRRLSISELLPSRLRINERYMLDLPAPHRILGAVDINTGHERSVAESTNARPGEWLQIQSGRDRLHENLAFEQLHDLVRFALDFYANRFAARQAQASEERRSTEPATVKQERALAVLEKHQSVMPAKAFREVRRELAEALKASKSEEEALDRRAALLAPLASAGMAALALNHELSREGRYIDKAIADLRRIARKHAIPELTAIAKDFEATRDRLSSIQELFAPLLTDMDKTAIDRLRVYPIAQQTVAAMRSLMPGVEFQLKGIAVSLRFPAGSLAEWNALLQNVLSNAWNAMLDSEVARVRLSGGRSARNREWLRVSDTGRGLTMPVEEAGKLFEPFARGLRISEDKRSIALGGQGLGLAIVRMIARRRKAEVEFVEPEPGYATSFEMSWKG